MDFENICSLLCLNKELEMHIYFIHGTEDVYILDSERTCVFKALVLLIYVYPRLANCTLTHPLILC